MTNNIKEYRKGAGMTQAELAERSGVTRTIINQLETGARQVTTSKTMTRIAEALGQPVSVIFVL